MANTGLNYPKTTVFATEIKFDQPLRDMGTHTVTDVLNFTTDTTDAQVGFGTIVELIADGTNEPTFDEAIKSAGTGIYDNTEGVTNLLLFFKSPSAYCVMITPLGVISEGGGGVVQLDTPTLTATVISDTEIDLSWTNVANESSYALYWSPNGSSSWTQIGGTIAANTTTYNHTGLTAATQYYYRIKAVGDGVAYGDSTYGTDDATTGSAPSLEDLTLSTNDGYTNTAQVFTATTPVAGWGKKGLDPKHLAAGTDGYIQCEYHADAEPMAFGFNTANSMDSGQASIDFGFIYFTGQCYPLKNNGTMTTAFSISDGDIMRVRRSGGSTMILEISTDGGSTWDTTGVVDPLFSTNSGDLYVISDINNTGKIYYPKGYGLV